MSHQLLLRQVQGIIPFRLLERAVYVRQELRHEIDDGVVVLGILRRDKLMGVMGDPARTRCYPYQACLCSERQKKSRDSEENCYSRLRKESTRPILIGTWAAAVWALRFLRKARLQIGFTRKKRIDC